MLGQKKEIILRRQTINGQNNRHLPCETRLSLFIKIINGLSLSRAFDNLFAHNKTQGTIIATGHGKVDKNLFDYLLKRNQTSFSDLRSRSPMQGSKSIYSKHSRSRTPLKKLRIKRKRHQGSVAGFSNQMPQSGNQLYRSQNLAKNPNYFKMTSEQEIPLSSVDHTGKSKK